MPTANVSIHLTKDTSEDGGSGNGDISVSITGVQTTTTSSGTVIEGSSEMPTVRIESTDGEVQGEKKAGTFLSATFTGIPTDKTYAVTATLPGYTAKSVRVQPNDFQSD